jgi:hypothetical protein
MNDRGGQPAFAFFHVGPDVEAPTVMVRSLRRHHAGARITQCTDPASPRIDGIDDIARVDISPQKIMLTRLMMFAELDIDAPTVFLDTDMICIRPIDPAHALGACDAAVCEREFGRDLVFSAQVADSFPELEGKILGQVYPFIGCFTITRSAAFWRKCLDVTLRLDERFHAWFGDQDGLRDVAAASGAAVGRLPESIYACPPNVPQAAGPQVKVLHFKGAGLKPMMRTAATTFGLM